MKDLTNEENKKMISSHPETLLLTHDTLEKKDHWYEVLPRSSLSEGNSLRNEEETLLPKKSFCSEEFSWKQWFKLPAFYLYGFVYMGSRVLVNVQSVRFEKLFTLLIIKSLIIFYLQNVLGIAKGTDTYDHGLPVEFAIIPMIVYLSSAVTSGILKRFYEKFGRKRIYVVGTSISIGATLAMMVLSEGSKNLMFGVAVFIGISQSICLNTGIGLIVYF